MAVSAPVMVSILTFRPCWAKNPCAWATYKPPSSATGTESTVRVRCSSWVVDALAGPPAAPQPASVPVAAIAAMAALIYDKFQKIN